MNGRRTAKPSGPTSWTTRAIRAQAGSTVGRGLAIVTALLALSWVASYLLGGAGRVPPHWFYLPVLVAAARFGLVGAALTAVVAGVVAGPLLPSDVAAGTPQAVTDWLSRLGFFVAIGLAMGAVIVRFRAALDRELTVTRDDHDLALRSAEERTRAIIETANEAVVGMDIGGRITDWNGAAERTFGWSREEAVGRELAETLVPAELRGAHRRGLAHYLATGEGPVLDSRIELQALHRDGHEFPVELTINALEVGGSLTFIAFVHDISARREAEDALREGEARLRDALEAKYGTLVEQLPAIVYEAEFGEHGAWRYVSPQIQEMLGFSPETWMAEPSLWWQRLDPEDRAQVMADEARSRRTGAPLMSEYRMVANDGRIVWFRDQAVTVRDGEGRPLFMQGVMYDVTDQKRAEERLRNVNAELEQRVLDRTAELESANRELLDRGRRLQEAREEADRANRAKSEFLSRMSHELRTPLNAVLGFGQLLGMDDLGDHQNEAVRQILRGGSHLLNLINEVLDIARIEAGRMQLSLEPVSVKSVLEDALALVRPLAAEKEVWLELEQSAKGDAHVMADRVRLQQVFLNLLSNGVKYNRAGGTVRCMVRSLDRERLAIDVADDGIGMSEDDRGRLFVPFERLGDGHDVEGTGLGLALSKQLVEVMGGTLHVDSAPQVGSTFTVELPAVAAPDEAWDGNAADDASRAETVATSRTVLCIEDNPANLKVIERIVALRPEISLVSAMQGGMGIELARTHRPDAILLDVGLPDMPGLEVMRRLHGDPATRGIPVVVVSADASQAQMRSLLAAGAREYVTKPLDIKRLMTLLDEILFAHVSHPTDGAGGEIEEAPALIDRGPRRR